MAALEPQRLVVRDARAVDVAGPRPPLAVGAHGLLGGLVVHGDLALELHVVEDRHLLRADDGHPPHLVRIEPRQVHVRRSCPTGSAGSRRPRPRRPASGTTRRAPRPRPAPRRAGGGSPTGRGRRGSRARSRRAGSCRGSGGCRRRTARRRARPTSTSSFSLRDARVVEEQVAGHEHEAARLGERDELLGLGTP